MALLNKREYTKKEPFRDATIFLIVCEGEKREPSYFIFFDKLVSQLKVIPIPSQHGKSAPNHLLENANKAIDKYNSDGGDYELWIVLDIDKWADKINRLQEECTSKKGWHIAISNPCFEVWLYYHFNEKMPKIECINNCSAWKELIPKINRGGFDSTKHPTLLSHAIRNSKANYSEKGYIPNIGSTQLYRLGEKIYHLTKRVLSKYEL